MRKEKGSKKKLFVILGAGFIVLSMVLSIFGIFIDNQSQSIPDYNKHSFKVIDNGYKTKINGTYKEFRYYPADLENINLSSGILSQIQNSQAIAFVFDPEDNITDNLLYIDLIRYEMESQVDKPVYFGVSKNSTKYPLSVVNCSSATDYLPIIMINSSADTGFYITEDNPYCIIMNARLKNILAAKDRLLYAYYGIMQ
jgi:hypothetical protein